MKETKETQQNNFFKFEKIGAKVQGKYKGLFNSKFGLVMQIDNYFVDLNKAAMKNILKDNIEKFNHSTKVEIEFIDEKKVKGQRNKVKIFRIKLNGKEIKSNFELKEASKEDIKTFFEI